MVALQPPRSAVLGEAAFVARFSQCAGDVLGNALPLLFNFWVKLRRVGLARHRLLNVPHDTTPPITAQEPRRDGRTFGGGKQQRPTQIRGAGFHISVIIRDIGGQPLSESTVTAIPRCFEIPLRADAKQITRFRLPPLRVRIQSRSRRGCRG